MKDRIAKLIDLKSIVTLLMVTALVVGFFMDKVNVEQFIPLVTMIITFYFAKKDSNDNIKDQGFIALTNDNKRGSL